MWSRRKGDTRRTEFDVPTILDGIPNTSNEKYAAATLVDATRALNRAIRDARAVGLRFQVAITDPRDMPDGGPQVGILDLHLPFPTR